MRWARAPRRRLRRAARVELPGGREEGCPGEKLPGKLEQLERAGAGLLHNSGAAAGRGGRSPAPAGPPTSAGARRE